MNFGAKKILLVYPPPQYSYLPSALMDNVDKFFPYTMPCKCLCNTLNWYQVVTGCHKWRYSLKRIANCHSLHCGGGAITLIGRYLQVCVHASRGRKGKYGQDL